jgi:hypothetical protein
VGHNYAVYTVQCIKDCKFIVLLVPWRGATLAYSRLRASRPTHAQVAPPPAPIPGRGEYRPLAPEDLATHVPDAEALKLPAGYHWCARLHVKSAGAPPWGPSLGWEGTPGRLSIKHPCCCTMSAPALLLDYQTMAQLNFSNSCPLQPPCTCASCAQVRDNDCAACQHH